MFFYEAFVVYEMMVNGRRNTTCRKGIFKPINDEKDNNSHNHANRHTSSKLIVLNRKILMGEYHVVLYITQFVYSLPQVLLCQNIVFQMLL